MDVFGAILPLGSPAVQEPKEFPLVVHLSRGNEQVTLVGASHTKVPGNPQFAAMEKAFQDFRAKVSGRVPLVGFEIVRPDCSAITRDEAILKFGERGLLDALTTEAGFPSANIEPKFADVIQSALDHGVSNVSLAAWALTNAVASSNAGTSTEVPTELVLGEIGKRFSIAQNAQDSERILSEYFLAHDLPDVAKEMKNLARSPDARAMLNGIQRPNIAGTELNKVAASINQARDFGLFTNSLAQCKNGYTDLFIVMGWNHVLSQIPAYEAEGFTRRKE
jgi:hypothetical protein